MAKMTRKYGEHDAERQSVVTRTFEKRQRRDRTYIENAWDILKWLIGLELIMYAGQIK